MDEAATFASFPEAAISSDAHTSTPISNSDTAISPPADTTTALIPAPIQPPSNIATPSTPSRAPGTPVTIYDLPPELLFILASTIVSTHTFSSLNALTRTSKHHHHWLNRELYRLKYKNSYTHAINIAVSAPTIRTAELFFAAGLNVKKPNYAPFVAGCPPLVSAVLSCKYEVVKLFLDKGAEVDAATPLAPVRRQRFCTELRWRGETALFFAIHNMDLTGTLTGVPVEIVRLLVERGADVNHQVDGWGCSTPLEQAIIHRRADLVEYLLANGADPNLAVGGGTTPLHIAVLPRDFKVPWDIIGHLIDAGADINAIDPQTQLSSAAAYRDRVMRGVYQPNEDVTRKLKVQLSEGDLAIAHRAYLWQNRRQLRNL